MVCCIIRNPQLKSPNPNSSTLKDNPRLEVDKIVSDNPRSTTHDDGKGDAKKDKSGTFKQVQWVPKSIELTQGS
ncbi:hypothetical protein ACH5RR_037243 [Cinchona calisaya]|uniref:Uncharacterized protein n=1 Tax=Cinchona calisaya TaxID=153742 RepID=A0ABD2Y984_9GENT